MRSTDGALLIISLVIAWSLYRAHTDKSGSFEYFNLADLLMEHGRVSRLACVFLGSFLVSSWVMIRLTLDGKMTDLLFGAYGAMWVAPIIAKLFGTNPPAEVKRDT